MASLRWTIPGKPSKGIILTKSDGTELTIVPEVYNGHNADNQEIYTHEGDCIKIPEEEDSVKVAGFKFDNLDSPPTSILYKVWDDRSERWQKSPEGRLYEINSDKLDTVELGDCPRWSQRGGRRRSSRKQRKSSRRSLKSRRAGRR
jgi:hypothetical protein